MEPGEGLAVKNICPVIIKSQLLLARGIVIQTCSDLVLTDFGVGDGTVCLRTYVWEGYKLGHQVSRCSSKAFWRNYVPREHARIRRTRRYRCSTQSVDRGGASWSGVQFSGNRRVLQYTREGLARGKVPGPLLHGGHGYRVGRDPIPHSTTFVGREEESFVTAYGATQCAAELVLLEIRLFRVEVAPCIQCCVAEILVGAPVKCIAAGLRNHVQYGTGVAAEVGIVVVRDKPKFSDSVRRRLN